MKGPKQNVIKRMGIEEYKNLPRQKEMEEISGSKQKFLANIQIMI